MVKNFVCTAGALALSAGLASAAGIMQLDVNSLNAQALDSGGNASVFGGTTHTGAIQLSFSASSSLTEVILNGVGQNIASGQLATFAGTINMVLGQVTGGSFALTLNNTDTFTTSILGGFGQVNTQAGQGFSVDGLTFNGVFSSTTFAGVNIAPWFNTQPLDGSFINFAFNPDAQTGFDSDADVDIFLRTGIIPTPLAGGMAGLGLFGLAARRRRA